MYGGRSTRWAALAVTALVLAAGCGNGPEEPLVTAAPSVAQLPPGLLDELAEQAAGALAGVAQRLPAPDAEALGRLGASGSPWSSEVSWSGNSDNSVTGVGDGAFGAGSVAEPAPSSEPAPAPDPAEAPPVAAPPAGATVDEPTVVPDVQFESDRTVVGQGVVGQGVLDAVRPVLDGPAFDAPAALVPFVRVPRSPDGTYGYVEFSGQDPTAAAADRLRQFGPDVIGWVTAITGALAEHDRVAPLLQVGAGTEPEIATAHGRAHLALAVVVAGIVVPAADAPVAGSGPEVVVGAAIDAAAQVLRARPMPGSYPAAELERRRAEYRLPRYGHGAVAVQGHRFGLVEGPLPATDEPTNGLVTVVPGGIVVRTGAESGAVPVTVHVLAEPPAADPDDRDLAVWHEIVEVGYIAEAGAASVGGPDPAGGGEPAEVTPPWPGSMRARVAARGRDDGDGERYDITVWAAPPAPEVIVKATDRLGHRLRGEPEPPVVVRPESAYRWLRDSSLAYAASVTVVTGSSAEQVITAFGGDPARPVPMDEALITDYEPWVTVLPVDGAVLAVELNGFQGSRDEVLRAASARGRAASMYWSVDGSNLAFARGGEVVDSFEPLFDHAAPDAEVRAALAGIDWLDYHDLNEKGLVAVERFTGRGIGPQDVDRIEEAAVAYRIPEGR